MGTLEEELRYNSYQGERSGWARASVVIEPRCGYDKELGMTPSAAEAFRPRPGAVVIECRGELDVTTMEHVGELFTDLVAENELVVIDLTEAEFIDSSFLHNLIKADRLARERGSRVRIQYGQSPIVWRALQLSGVSKSLELVGSRDEALAGVPEQAA